MGILILLILGGLGVTAAVFAARTRSKVQASSRFAAPVVAPGTNLFQAGGFSTTSRGTEEHPIVHATDLSAEAITVLQEEIKGDINQIIEGMGRLSEKIDVKPVPAGSDYYPGCIAFDINDLETGSGAGEGDIANIFTIVFYPESPPPNHTRLKSFVNVRDVRGSPPEAIFKTDHGDKWMHAWSSRLGEFSGNDGEKHFMSWSDVINAREGQWEELCDWSLLLEALPGYEVGGIAGIHLPCAVILFRGRTSWADRARRRWRNAWGEWGAFLGRCIGIVAAFVGTVFTFGVGAPAFITATVSLTSAIIKKVQDYGKSLAEAKAEAMQEYQDAAAGMSKMLEYFSFNCTNPDNNDCYDIQKITIYVATDTGTSSTADYVSSVDTTGKPSMGAVRG